MKIVEVQVYVGSFFYGRVVQLTVIHCNSINVFS